MADSAGSTLRMPPREPLALRPEVSQSRVDLELKERREEQRRLEERLQSRLNKLRDPKFAAPLSPPPCAPVPEVQQTLKELAERVLRLETTCSWERFEGLQQRLEADVRSQVGKIQGEWQSLGSSLRGDLTQELTKMELSLRGRLTTLVDEVHVSRLESSECLSSLQTAEDASRRLQQQAAENERALEQVKALQETLDSGLKSEIAGAQSLVEKAQQLFQDFADLAHSERGKMEAVMASERSEMKQLRLDLVECKSELAASQLEKERKSQCELLELEKTYALKLEEALRRLEQRCEAAQQVAAEASGAAGLAARKQEELAKSEKLSAQREAQEASQRGEALNRELLRQHAEHQRELQELNLKSEASHRELLRQQAEYQRELQELNLKSEASHRELQRQQAENQRELQESTLKSEALNRELQRVQVEQQLELQEVAQAAAEAKRVASDVKLKQEESARKIEMDAVQREVQRLQAEQQRWMQDAALKNEGTSKDLQRLQAEHQREMQDAALKNEGISKDLQRLQAEHQREMQEVLQALSSSAMDAESTKRLALEVKLRQEDLQMKHETLARELQRYQNEQQRELQELALKNEGLQRELQRLHSERQRELESLQVEQQRELQAWGKFQSAVQGQLAEMSSEASAAELRQQKLMAQESERRQSLSGALQRLDALEKRQAEEKLARREELQRAEKSLQQQLDRCAALEAQLQAEQRSGRGEIQALLAKADSQLRDVQAQEQRAERTGQEFQAAIQQQCGQHMELCKTIEADLKAQLRDGLQAREQHEVSQRSVHEEFRDRLGEVDARLKEAREAAREAQAAKALATQALQGVETRSESFSQFALEQQQALVQSFREVAKVALTARLERGLESATQQDITEKLAAHLEERMQWKDSWQLLHDAPKRSSSLGSLVTSLRDGLSRISKLLPEDYPACASPIWNEASPGSPGLGVALESRPPRPPSLVIAWPREPGAQWPSEATRACND